jgi:hypothetical protein
MLWVGGRDDHVLKYGGWVDHVWLNEFLSGLCRR